MRICIASPVILVAMSSDLVSDPMARKKLSINLESAFHLSINWSLEAYRANRWGSDMAQGALHARKRLDMLGKYNLLIFVYQDPEKEKTDEEL